MKNILEYYENYDEESRLIKDKAHKIEFITTVHFLDKVISENSKILEVGAGTGRYSFYYAERGFKVTALDITPKHTELMKAKAKEKDLNVDIILGNGKDLNSIEDNSYDVVLCLGPLYHFMKEDERKQCIYECLRVLKKGGVLAVAYVNRYATFVNFVNRNKDNINSKELHNIIKSGVEYGDERDCFYHSTYHELEKLMNKFNVEKIHHIGTDGIGGTLRDKLNEFNENEFNKWMEYHLMTCTDSSLIGYSQHGLYICEKL